MKHDSHTRKNQTLVLALLRSQQLFMRAMGPVFRSAGLTASQWDALETLNSMGELSINDLMALTLGTSGNLDVVVKNLTQAGWVEKAVDKQDRRARVLRLTKAGKAKVDSFMPLHNAALDDIFRKLSGDEKRQTISTLNRLRKKLPQSKKD